MYVLDNGCICIYVCMYCIVCLYVCKIQYSYSYFCVLICMFVCMCIYFPLFLSDPNLRVDQVGVPVLGAKVMTVPGNSQSL